MENEKENSCKWKPNTRPVLAIVCIVCAASVLLAILLLYKNDRVANDSTEPLQYNTQKPVVRKKRVPLPYPHCIRDDRIFLDTLIFKIITCNLTAPILLPSSTVSSSSSPTCQQPVVGSTSVSANETRGVIIVYAAIALLLASLGAAFIEVWRARIVPARNAAPGPVIPGSNSATTPREKPELSRRCSLADLTVLRHNRRESMMRRDSAMQICVDNGNGGSNATQHRIPLKHLGTSKSQDESRRSSQCTVPLPHSKSGKWQRTISADKANEHQHDIVARHRIHMIRHH